jgi:oligopeptide transport system substrate-binding protein
MNSNCTMKALTCAVLLASAGLAAAATVPAGVKLHETQELVRNNGSEPETLDAALATGGRPTMSSATCSKGCAPPTRTARSCPAWPRAGSRLTPDLGLQAAQERQVVQRRPGDRRRLHLQHAPLCRPEDRLEIRLHLRRLPAQWQRNRRGQEARHRSGRQGCRQATRWKSRHHFPVSFLPEVVSNQQPGPLHKATIEKFGKDWTRPANMVNNGAFVLKDWQVNSKIILVKNPQYWDAKNVQLTK